MFVRVTWMSGCKVFEASCITIALILIFMLSLEHFYIHAISYELAKRFYLELFTSLRILVLIYVAFFIYYMLSRKVIE